MVSLYNSINMLYLWQGSNAEDGKTGNRERIDGMQDIEEILFDEEAIAAKVGELALLISRDYAGKEPVLVCVLKAAAVFTTDLARCLTCPVTIEFIQAGSYGASATSSRNVLIKKDIETDIRGRHVLLVDTIIDTGETMDCLLRRFAERKPASLNIVVLLDKKCKRAVEVPVAYKGIEIPDRFVVGYGMDFGEKYRNLPYIAALRPPV
jgi:hypoxanthine phosphoribosyltransferase